MEIMKAMYGRKIGMTRIFTEAGESVPVTVLEMTPNIVQQVKSKESDGYAAIQVGVGEQKPQRVNRALTGHFAKAKKGAPFFVGEIRLDYPGRELKQEFQVGDELNLSGAFEVGNVVDVVGITKGAGFAGVIKRHGMKGFPMTRGTHEYRRHGGSIGNRKFPGRVFKNKRMPGHMGVDRITQQGLEVMAVRPEDNALLVRGSIPGSKNSYVFIRQSVKGA